jgi:hypothetical protein
LDRGTSEDEIEKGVNFEDREFGVEEEERM